MKIRVTHNKAADTLYLRFSDSKTKNSKNLDRNRVVDYSEDGEIKGIEFSSISFGIKTDDLPHKSAIERALRESNVHSILQDTVISAESIRRNIGSITKKARLKGKAYAAIWAILAAVIYTSSIAADIFLARNLFVLTSLTGLLSSLFGLIISLIPTVAGCLFLLILAVYYIRKTPLPAAQEGL